MPITVEWDTTLPNVIYKCYIGTYTWEEYSQAIEEDNNMMRAKSPTTIDLIIHYADRDSQLPPTGSSTHWRRALKNDPPNRGVAVIVPKTRLTESNVNLARILFPPPLASQILMASSVGAAHNLIREIKSARESGLD